VRFKRSRKTATWPPEAGSLLDFAEALGLELPYSRRTGMRGKRVQQVEWGETATICKTVAMMCPGQELLCSSVPIFDLEIDIYRPPPLRLNQTRHGAFGRGSTDCIV
jgi:hypothetical protein